MTILEQFKSLNLNKKKKKKSCTNKVGGVKMKKKKPCFAIFKKHIFFTALFACSFGFVFQR